MLECICPGHLLGVVHPLLRLLKVGVICRRLERRHIHIHIFRFLLLHTVISLGLVALRHHIVSIEVIANVYSAISGIWVSLRLLWLVRRWLLECWLVAATASVALIVVIYGLVELWIGTLLSLWLILLIRLRLLRLSSSRFVMLLLRRLLLYVLLLLFTFKGPALLVWWMRRLSRLLQNRVLFSKSVVDLLAKARWLGEENHVGFELFQELFLDLILCNLKGFLDYVVAVLVREEIIERVSLHDFMYHFTSYVVAGVFKALFDHIWRELLLAQRKEDAKKLLADFPADFWGFKV